MLFSAMKNQKKIDLVNKILEENPELIPKLEEFKNSDPLAFNSSVVNFDTNVVTLDLLEKLASGKRLTWYDWM
jgi:hypothetical protein